MSWKSLVTTGLFCLLAVPAFAAPTFTLVPGGTFASNKLDANGNWVWKVQVTPDVAPGVIPDNSGTPVALEAGFTSTNRDLLNATMLVNPDSNTGFDKVNPGTVVFGGWQTAGNALLDANSNNRPTGIQTNCPSGNCSTGNFPTTPTGNSYAADSSVTGALNQVFAALGSINFTAAGPKDVFTITVKGPSTTGPALSTTIQASGAYGGNGRLTQVTGMSGTTYTTSNFDTVTGSFTQTARRGDTNLDGTNNSFDVTPFLLGFQAGTGKWFNGDYTGDGVVNSFDTTQLLLGLSDPPGAGSGGGLSAGSSVPEPASAALLGLALVGGMGLVRRKR